MLKLTGLSFSSPVSCSQALFLLLQHRSSAHSLFVLLRPRPASLSALFLSLFFFFCVALLSWLRSVVLSLLSPPRWLLFSLSILFISYLHTKKMEIENGADTVALDHFSSQAILAIQFSRCQRVECRVARRSSRTAFIVEQPVWGTVQVNNSSSLGMSLVWPCYWSSKELWLASWAQFLVSIWAVREGGVLMEDTWEVIDLANMCALSL